MKMRSIASTIATLLVCSPLCSAQKNQEKVEKFTQKVELERDPASPPEMSGGLDEAAVMEAQETMVMLSDNSQKEVSPFIIVPRKGSYSMKEVFGVKEPDLMLGEREDKRSTYNVTFQVGEVEARPVYVGLRVPEGASVEYIENIAEGSKLDDFIRSIDLGATKRIEQCSGGSRCTRTCAHNPKKCCQYTCI